MLPPRAHPPHNDVGGLQGSYCDDVLGAVRFIRGQRPVVHATSAAAQVGGGGGVCRKG